MRRAVVTHGYCLKSGYNKSLKICILKTFFKASSVLRMNHSAANLNSLGLGIFYDQNSAHSKESKQTIHQNSDASAYFMVRIYLAIPEYIA
jgi:hypothetical protein